MTSKINQNQVCNKFYIMSRLMSRSCHKRKSASLHLALYLLFVKWHVLSKETSEIQPTKLRNGKLLAHSYGSSFIKSMCSFTMLTQSPEKLCFVSEQFIFSEHNCDFTYSLSNKRQQNQTGEKLMLSTTGQNAMQSRVHESLRTELLNSVIF